MGTGYGGGVSVPDWGEVGGVKRPTSSAPDGKGPDRGGGCQKSGQGGRWGVMKRWVTGTGGETGFF